MMFRAYSLKTILSIALTATVLCLIGCSGGGDPITNPNDPFSDDPYLDPSDIPHWTPDVQNERTQVQEDEWLVTDDNVGLHLIVHRPEDSSAANQYPGLLLIPGGLQPGAAWHARWRKSNAWEFVDAGMIVLLYDSRGRGFSAGDEDYNGPVNQDDLADIIDWFNSREDVLSGGIGIATSSWGITVAAGTLARYPELDCRFLLDLEGAQDRYVMTQWNDEKWLGIMHGHVTSDDEFWDTREAITYIGDVLCPYYRIQSGLDHAMDYFFVDHAIELVNAAVNGESSFVRMNEMEPGIQYDMAIAQTYDWYPIGDLDNIFFDMVLRAMSYHTELD